MLLLILSSFCLRLLFALVVSSSTGASVAFFSFLRLRQQVFVFSPQAFWSRMNCLFCCWLAPNLERIDVLSVSLDQGLYLFRMDCNSSGWKNRYCSLPRLDEEGSFQVQLILLFDEPLHKGDCVVWPQHQYSIWEIHLRIHKWVKYQQRITGHKDINGTFNEKNSSQRSTHPKRKINNSLEARLLISKQSFPKKKRNWIEQLGRYMSKKT